MTGLVESTTADDQSARGEVRDITEPIPDPEFGGRGADGWFAAIDGWRVCVVDTVDELNANAANALLKILEEPPEFRLADAYSGVLNLDLDPINRLISSSLHREGDCSCFRELRRIAQQIDRSLS